MKRQQKINKPYPIGAVIAADILVFALSLSVFCYFHHIKSLWGIGQSEKHGMEALEDVREDAVQSSDPTDSADGDFGDSFPHVFSDSGTVTLENDAEIRGYLAENGLTPERSLNYITDDYIGLYRSGDIFMTAEKISANTYYNDKTYFVTYYLYDVYVRDLENLYTVAVDDREPITDLALSSYALENADGETYVTSPAILAVNGDYIGNENHTYFAVRNNILMRDSDYIGADICVLWNDGTMETISAAEFDRDELISREPYQVWEFGPSLLDENGGAIYDFDDTFYDKNVLTSRHPRSSIGYFEAGHYCFIVVDGRSEESDGVRLFQLSEIYEALGCSVAYNFDGGDSAQSLWMGEEHRTDEERVLDGDNQRKLYDIVCIGEVVKE